MKRRQLVKGLLLAPLATLLPASAPQGSGPKFTSKEDFLNTMRKIHGTLNKENITELRNSMLEIFNDPGELISYYDYVHPTPEERAANNHMGHNIVVHHEYQQRAIDWLKDDRCLDTLELMVAMDLITDGECMWDDDYESEYMVYQIEELIDSRESKDLPFDPKDKYGMWS
jgi:hypothetical protein